MPSCYFPSLRELQQIAAQLNVRFATITDEIGIVAVQAFRVDTPNDILPVMRLRFDRANPPCHLCIDVGVPIADNFTPALDQAIEGLQPPKPKRPARKPHHGVARHYWQQGAVPWKLQ